MVTDIISRYPKAFLGILKLTKLLTYKIFLKFDTLLPTFKYHEYCHDPNSGSILQKSIYKKGKITFFGSFDRTPLRNYLLIKKNAVSGSYMDPLQGVEYISV